MHAYFSRFSLSLSLSRRLARAPLVHAGRTMNFIHHPFIPIFDTHFQRSWRITDLRYTHIYERNICTTGKPAKVIQALLQWLAEAKRIKLESPISRLFAPDPVHSSRHGCVSSLDLLPGSKIDLFRSIARNECRAADFSVELDRTRWLGARVNSKTRTLLIIRANETAGRSCSVEV